ncbi:hypothetical protein HD554DRAFT_2329646 [Boletus coccyginus]|nr:hypothetical protein HD554DRAFT_2329646 [Boletus coccyginus]
MWGGGEEAISGSEVLSDREDSWYNVGADHTTATQTRPYKENLCKVILSRGEPLRGNQELSELFPDPPPKHHIHIILGSKPDQRFKIRIVGSADVDDLKDTIKKKETTSFRDVDTQHMRLYRISGAKDELEESLNKTHDGDQLCGGTLGSNSLCFPVLDPFCIVVEVESSAIFGQFVDDCQTGTMTQEDNQFVGKLANAMSDLYEKEADRIQAVGGLFRETDLDFRIHEKDTGTWYTMDAHMSLDSDLNPGPPYMVAGFKNEAAISASEPYIQAVAYYLEATRTYAPKMLGSTLPCFLLVLFG